MVNLLWNTRKWLVLIMCLITPQMAQAVQSKYALLVGVTDYPSLSDDLQLDGPVNDIRAISKMLKQKGFESSNIQIYAELIKGAKSPTKKHIMDGLASLAKKTNDNSFVYLQFSGHGSQQPAPKNSDEADGRDEIFLPKDIGKWDDALGKVKNAIVDNEVRDAVQKIRNTGASVWVVFDSCHSGTMARGLIKTRNVDPIKGLGIPERRFSLNTNRIISMRGKDNGKDDTMMRGTFSSKSNIQGKMIAFYAAQSTETTPEMKLPRGVNATKQKSYGLFTYALLKALGSSSHISYRQLSERIFQIYSELDWSGSRPLVEGDQDEGVFGETVGKAIRQWALDKDDDGHLTVPAGSMHMLSEGAILAVVSMPTSLDEDALGYLSASEVDDFSSTLAPVIKKGENIDYHAFDLKDFKWGQYARLVDPNLHYELKIFSDMSGTSHTGINAAIERFRKDGIKNVNVHWVDTLEDADLRIMGKNNRVYLLAPGEDIASQNTISAEFSFTEGPHDPQLESWLSSSIASIAKVKNLMTLSMGVGTSFPDVKMKVTVKRKVMVKQKPEFKEINIDGATIPDLKNKDVVRFEVENNASQAMDITILFKDSNYGLTLIFPQSGHSNRIESLGKKTVKLGTIQSKTSLGREGLIVIAVPAKKDSPRSDFAFLAQKSISTVKQKGIGHALIQRSLFETAGFDMPRKRGLDSKEYEFQMRFFQWNTVR